MRARCEFCSKKLGDTKDYWDWINSKIFICSKCKNNQATQSGGGEMKGFCIKMVKTCKCGKKFETKPSDKRNLCNKCLLGIPRKEDLILVKEAIKQL
jgi:hypothetical protein